MEDPLEFIKQELNSKLTSIDKAIQIHRERAAAYREERQQICEQMKVIETDKINIEFNNLFLSLQNKQESVIQQINNTFNVIMDRQTLSYENGKCEAVISDLLSSKDRVESLLSADTPRRTFFKESVVIGQLIQQDLNAIMQYQIEHFEDSTDTIEFPTFKLEMDKSISAIQEITLIESNPPLTPEAIELESIPLSSDNLTAATIDQTISLDLPPLTHDTDPNTEVLSTIDSQAIPTKETDFIQNDLATEDEGNTINIVSNELSAEKTDLVIHDINTLNIASNGLSAEKNDNPELISKVGSGQATESHPVVPFESLSAKHKYKFVVTHVASPSYLYLQLVTKEFNQMIPGITEYHTNIDENPEEAKPVNPDSITKGRYFFAKYDIDGCWYRALILQTETEHPQKVNVYFIDYGNPGLVSMDNLRPIPEKYATFPQQAFVASLYNIKPTGSDVIIITPTNDDEWTLPSMKYKWEQHVIQWVDIILDAHRLVYGLISQCGKSNHLELDLILSTGTVCEILDSNLISFTPSQLTLLDSDHVSLRELLISGSMGIEADPNHIDSLSFYTSNSSTHETAPVSSPEFSEIFGTLRSDHENEYLFPNIFQEDGSFSCMLAATDSPDLFYVNIIHIGATIIDRIASEIVSYMDAGILGRTLIRVKQPCLAFYVEDELWYRGIVLEMKPSEDKYFVFFVEFGSTSWVTEKQIQPINNKLFRYPVQAIPCRLYGIKPKNKFLWPLEAVEEFTKLSGPTSILNAFMISCEPHERIHNNISIMKEFVINIRLYECNNPKSVNECLIELGYAETIDSTRETDVSASSLSFSNSPDLDNWNPMENDFLSANNNYQYEDDNIDIAIQGYKDPDQSHICRYYNSTRGCRRGTSCKYTHTLYSKRNRFRMKEIPFSYSIQELPSLNSFILCKITGIQSPYNFYITCPYGCVDLEEDILSHSDNIKRFFEEKFPIEETEFYLLNKNIQDFYDTEAYPVPLDYYSNGEIVIVHSSAHNWCRSRIIEPESIKVFYVDYGYSEIVGNTDIRQIEKRFLFTPFQAIPCVLSGIVPIIDKLDEARERLDTLATNRNFLARVEGRVDKGQLCLYFLPNENEPMNCNLPCNCLNDLLFNEGYYERCGNREECKIKFFPG